jgi:hypothetical protein
MKLILAVTFMLVGSIAHAAAEPTATDRPIESDCSATYQTVVFDYPKPVTDPIFNKLYSYTKQLEGSAPDDILRGALGQDQYKVLARDRIVIVADGKPHLYESPSGWTFSYTTSVVNGQVKTWLTGSETGGENPRKLGAGWTAYEGQSTEQVWGKPSYAYGFVSQLLRSNCI